MSEELICNQFFPMKHSLVRHKFMKRDIAESSAKRGFLSDFPHKDSAAFKNTSILSIGGNLKNPIKTFKILFQKLRKNSRITLLSTSPIYKNPPFGYTKQSDFYNATIILSTSLCLIEFYNLVFYLERVFGRGRKREFKNAPRILDIDILFFNDIFLRTKKMNIPHLHWQERKSVLVPLFYETNFKGF